MVLRTTFGRPWPYCVAHLCHIASVSGRRAEEKTEAALRAAGYEKEADAVGAVRRRRNWSPYVVRLIADLQQALRDRGMIDKLRFLLYPSRLTEQDAAIIRKDDEGVIWLGKDSEE